MKTKNLWKNGMLVIGLIVIMMMMTTAVSVSAEDTIRRSDEPNPDDAVIDQDTGSDEPGESLIAPAPDDDKTDGDQTADEGNIIATLGIPALGVAGFIAALAVILVILKRRQ
jgi:hypothetical protein